MEVRSYHHVFSPERRLYRIDRIVLTPAGIPVRALVYFATLAATGTLARQIPGVSALFGLLPWPVWIVALPAAIATTLTTLRIDGRDAHLLVEPLVLYALRWIQTRRFGRTVRFDPRPSLVVPGKRVRYSGPGWISVASGYRFFPNDSTRLRMRRRHRRPTLEVTSPVDRGRDPIKLWVPAGASVLVTHANENRDS